MRADLEDGTIHHHDSFRWPDHITKPRVINTCDEVKELLKKSREFQSLRVIEFSPEVKRRYVSLKSQKSLMVASHVLHVPTYIVSRLYSSSKLPSSGR